MAKRRKISDKRVNDLLNKADRIAKEDAKRPHRTKFVSVGKGDTLASGGDHATYSQGENVSRVKWDHIFMDDAEFKSAHRMTKEQARKKGLVE
jgi:hypothetical protein